MIALGITLGPHGAAALAKDGTVVAAVEESRFRSVTDPLAIPTHALAFCRDWANENDLCASMAIYELPCAHSCGGELRFGDELIAEERVETIVKEHFGSTIRFEQVLQWETETPFALAESRFDSAAFLHLDPHQDEAVSWNQGSYSLLMISQFPHTLGALYLATSRHLGFGDEVERMQDLASWGEPTFKFSLARLFKDPADPSSEIDLSYCAWQDDPSAAFSERFAQRFGPPRESWEPIDAIHAHLAASVQCLIEERALAITEWLSERTQLDCLCFDGLLAGNASISGRLIYEAPFQHLHISILPGNSGLALRMALSCSDQDRSRHKAFRGTLLGPEYTSEEISPLLEGRSTGLDLPHVLSLLSEGKLVGWFHGRADFGPYPGGGRVILADPARIDAIERLRQLLDLEEFRSITAVCTHHAIGSICESRKHSERHSPPPTPYCAPIREGAADALAAVIQEDGRARVFVIEPETVPALHALLMARNQAGSTSVLAAAPFESPQFGRVTTPEEALAFFEGTNLDALVIENFLIER